MTSSDLFWYQDPKILIRQTRLIEFFPHDEMTLYEKLNAMVRFALYFALLIFVLKRNKNMMLFPIFVAGLTLYLFKMDYNPNKLENFFTSSRNHKEKCQPSSEENPFMNVLISDYTENPNRPRACDVNDKNVKNDIKNNFEKNLYQNTVDIWGRNNSQREYYTMPNTTIPNDQINFANWLYKSPSTCKELTQFCKVEQDIRHKRKPVDQLKSE